MFELVLIVSALGFVMASLPRYRAGNPFQVYFAVWFFFFIVYGASRSTWVAVGEVFWQVVLLIHLVWLLGLVFYRNVLAKGPPVQFNIHRIRQVPLFVMQLACALLLPLAYMKAQQISGGVYLFEHDGYRGLRHKLSEEEIGYGWTAYLVVLSFVVTSVTAILKFHGKIGWSRFSGSIIISLGYAFLSTGRTFILMFFILVLAPLFLTGLIKGRALVIAAAVMLGFFLLNAMLLGKGASLESSIAENLGDFLQNIRGYTVAPFVAFSRLMESQTDTAGGEYTFRFLYKIFDTIGFSGLEVTRLIRDYDAVPDLTNVYTVYDPYFRDFGYFGFCIAPMLMAFHGYLYRRAQRGSEIYVFLYSASLYPLAMQFFQDQYVSLLSTWIQVTAWYLILVGPRIRIRIRGREHD